MTDIKPVNQQPMSDDQELAKVLAGVSNDTDDADEKTPENQIETTQVPHPVDTSATDANIPAIPSLIPANPVAENDEPEDTTLGTIMPDSLPTPSPSPSGDLEDIKKDAIVELRPLVDKLSLAPDEKFDTYLLLLRSTDDKELIAPAHEAAKNIEDETRRAQALLDIIKEIDYLSGQKAA